MKFVNREQELTALDAMWQRPGAQFLVLYGRRRVGKTALLLRWAADKPAIYWVARRTSTTNLLRDFSQAIYRHEHPAAPVDPAFSFPSWEMALRQAGHLAVDERLLLILDELPYAFAADPSLSSTLQLVWDHDLQHTNLFLVAAGSRIGMVEQEMLSYRAPLYGRATGKMLLRPLPFYALAEFFPRYSAVQRVWQQVGGQLNAFVGRTAFEDLCRTWVLTAGDQEDLPFVPERVGRYWDAHTEIDVAAISWSDQALLLGEARWRAQPVGVPVLDRLKAKAERIRPGHDWAVHRPCSVVPASPGHCTSGLRPARCC
ncbi:MAG: ATP-binding protein [Anaerolineae bacterium]